MGLCESIASVVKDEVLLSKLPKTAEVHQSEDYGTAETDMVDVILPPGSEPGAIVQLSISDGRLIEVTVPEGAQAGDTIKARVPRRKQSRWATLHDAFNFLDPGHTGFITDHFRFVEVASELADMDGNESSIWSTLDQDGNGCVNWPEFVEWAEAHHVSLPMGMSEAGDEKIAFPSTWTGPTDDPKWIKREDVTDATHFMELDDLIQKTYKNVWTRDRKATGVNKVPKGYELIRAERCENFKDWRRYYMKRHQMAHACSHKEGFMQRQALTGKASGICTRQHLRPYCNEWLLFHGTSKKAADSILSGAGDFVISLAGSATGTLYGKGTYFAESITKADEYAKLEDDMCCVLVCRVIGGHVLYNDEVTPNPDELQRRCISGEHHSIIGDREKCRNTFKEYVIFDADQVYVEYALYYKRQYG